MVLYVGETLTIKVAATNPLRGGALIDDGVCTVQVFPVGADPKNDPTVRDTFTEHDALWDEGAGAYLAYVPTEGLEAGKYAYRAVLTGTYDSWEYGSFTLKP